MANAPRNPLNLGLAEGVRQLGFRKWYERELRSSHAHLLLTLLSAVGLLGTLEAMDGSSAQLKLVNAVLFIISAAIGVWALRRYLYLLMHAEDLANQANCPSCATYGKFSLLSDNKRDSQIKVCCRRCNQSWDINY